MLSFLRVFVALAIAFFAIGSDAHAGHSHGKRATKQALDRNPPFNSLPNAGGPRIPYNGTGPVPSFDQTSTPPKPITPITNMKELEDIFYREIRALNAGKTSFSGECHQCIAITEVLHLAAVTMPVDNFVSLIIRYCEATNEFNGAIFAVSCHAEYAVKPEHPHKFTSDAGGVGPYWAQLYSKMSLATEDMQAWCFFEFFTCELPAVIKINEGAFFSPKPESAKIAPKPSGEIINVLHLTDWHIDPRYDIGSEANCTQFLCCRPYATNTDLNTNNHDPSVPASRFGYLFCDAPADLAISAFDTMHQFFNKEDNAFVIFTGDIISHDNDDQISKDYVEYSERITYETFKAHMGNVPIYPTLGNHDNFPEAFTTPNNIDKGTKNANPMSYNYKLLSSLWEKNDWITSSEAEFASTHYGGYAHTTKEGLRIISINSDFWYIDNIFNYYSFTNPDVSGTMRFLANELAASEAKSQRAWIIAHVPSGYDGTNSLPNPTALFYSIVARFSPATIAAVFFGHTHEDQLQLFYDFKEGSLDKDGLRNTTDVDHSKPLMVGFIGPSITPLSGLNAGYQRIQVDAKTFEVHGVQTYFANVSESLTWTSPVWQFEYDARKTYNVFNWPETAPLNATFYDKLTEEMLKDQKLVEIFNTFETKSSAVGAPCNTKACGAQKVCYIRSGSAALGLMCPQNDGPF